MKAKYYIYKNLHTGGFSVRFRGKVVDRLNNFTASNIKFKVSEYGRQRVILENRKNVHAFAVADKYKGLINKEYKLDNLPAVMYNPYLHKQFKCNGTDIYDANEIVFKNGKCFFIK